MSILRLVVGVLVAAVVAPLLIAAWLIIDDGPPYPPEGDL